MQRKRKDPVYESVGEAGCRESWCGRHTQHHPRPAACRQRADNHAVCHLTDHVWSTEYRSGPGMVRWTGTHWELGLFRKLSGAGCSAKPQKRPQGSEQEGVGRLRPAEDALVSLSDGPPAAAWVPAQPHLFPQAYNRPTTDAFPRLWVGEWVHDKTLAPVTSQSLLSSSPILRPLLL